MPESSATSASFVTKKVRSYRRMFMEMDFRDLMGRLSADGGTNMDVFIRYCLEHCPHYQNQLPA